MLSIGKLAHLAQVYDKGAPPSERKLGRKSQICRAGGGDSQILVGFHDQLDFVSVHDALLEDLRSALVGVRGRHSLESQIDILVKAKASKLAGRKGLLHVSDDFSSLRHSS
jgi:nuclear pore complex protein Nup133